MSILPLPNFAGAGYNYLFQERFINQPRTSSTSRLDYHVTDKDTISTTFKTWDANSTGFHVAAGITYPGLALMQYSFSSYQGTVDWTRVVSSHIVNELYAGGLHDVEASPPYGSIAFRSVAASSTRSSGRTRERSILWGSSTTRGIL